MVYFTSDWHLNETRIGKFNPFFRPFKNIEEQNETIINQINNRVKLDDVLYHIGDVSMDKSGIKLLEHIKCKNRYLIIGNHDEDKLPELSNYFLDVIPEKTINIASETFYLNHYPTNRHKDFFTITGHVHGLWKVKRNMVNVSVDAWHFNPVSEEEIFFIKNAIKNDYDENIFII